MAIGELFTMVVIAERTFDGLEEMKALVGGGVELFLGSAVREAIVNERTRDVLKGRSLDERSEQWPQRVQ